MDDFRTVKDLKAERDDLTNKISSYTNQLKIAEDEIKKLSKQVSILDKKINEIENPLKKQRVAITEHALLRYLERVYKFDIKKLKENLLTEKVIEYIKNYKSGKITENGITYVFKNKVIVTILVEEKKV